MRDGTEFSMTYNLQPSLHIRVYATCVTIHVWPVTRQPCFSLLFKHNFIYFAQALASDAEDDLNFLECD